MSATMGAARGAEMGEVMGEVREPVPLTSTAPAGPPGAGGARAGSAGGSGARAAVVNTLVALCISALSIALYDKFVRQPSTPRLAVIDVAKLYGEAERLATQRALERQAGVASGEVDAANAGFAGGARAAIDFGPALEQTLHTVSAECRCAIVAMAAVYGHDASVPDFTGEVSQRLRTLALNVPANTAPARAMP